MKRIGALGGALFFRIRSFAPLPVIALILFLSWRVHVYPGPGGAAVDETLNFVGLALCFSGAIIRFTTVGFIAPNTSSQSRRFKAHALNTQGPYAVVRHPLYFGNFFITLGLLCIAHEPWAWLLGLGYFTLSHFFIIASEEALLRSTFGIQYESWAKRVSIWRPTLANPLRGTFAWKRAVQREMNPTVAWGMGATVLLMWEFFARSELSPGLAQKLSGVLGTLLLLLAANKVWKKFG